MPHFMSNCNATLYDAVLRRRPVHSAAGGEETASAADQSPLRASAPFAPAGGINEAVR